MKKPPLKGAAIGLGNAVPNEFEIARSSSNNPDGPSNKPTFDLDGTRFPKGKMSFVNNVARGESPQAPDINHVTTNGTSKSHGQGKNAQYNWGDNLSGEWNENSKDWPGGNMTGQ